MFKACNMVIPWLTGFVDLCTNCTYMQPSLIISVHVAL